MADRFALINAPGAGALARSLRRRGGFRVVRAKDEAAVGAFLAARGPDDVVLVYSDGPLAPAWLAECASRQVLVVTAVQDGLAPADGQAVLSGVPAQTLADALLDADLDANGRIQVRELTQWLRDRAPDARLQSRLGRPYAVTDVEARLPPRLTLPLSAGAAVLIVALALPWLDGTSGFTLAFSAGTEWPDRVPALAAVLLAALAAGFAAWKRTPWPVAVSAAAALGCWLGFAERWDGASLGAGALLAYVGGALLLGATAHATILTRSPRAVDLPVGWIVALAAVVVAFTIIGRLDGTAVTVWLVITPFVWGVVAAMRPRFQEQPAVRYVILASLAALMTGYALVGPGYVSTVVAAGIMCAAAVVGLSRACPVAAR